MKTKLNIELAVWVGVKPKPITVLVTYQKVTRGQNYVHHVATIHTRPHRSKAKAISLADRIKADPSTLDALRNEPGIIDHRQPGKELIQPMYQMKAGEPWGPLPTPMKGGQH